MGMTPPSLHLVPFANYVFCLLIVVVEGSGVGIVLLGCVVYVDVHGEIMLWVAAT